MKRIAKIFSLVFVIMSISTLCACSMLSGTYVYEDEYSKIEIEFSLNNLTCTIYEEDGEVFEYKAKYTVKKDKMVLKIRENGKTFREIWTFEKGEGFIVLEGEKYYLK